MSVYSNELQMDLYPRNQNQNQNQQKHVLDSALARTAHSATLECR